METKDELYLMGILVIAATMSSTWGLSIALLYYDENIAWWESVSITCAGASVITASVVLFAPWEASLNGHFIIPSSQLRQNGGDRSVGPTAMEYCVFCMINALTISSAMYSVTVIPLGVAFTLIYSSPVWRAGWLALTSTVASEVLITTAVGFIGVICSTQLWQCGSSSFSLAGILAAMFAGIAQAINSAWSASLFCDQPIARTSLVTLVLGSICSGMFGICSYSLSVITDLFTFPDVKLSGFDTGALLLVSCFVGAGLLQLRTTAYRNAGGSLRVLNVIYIEIPVAFAMQMFVLGSSVDAMELLGAALIVGSAIHGAYQAQAQRQEADATSQEEPCTTHTTTGGENNPLLADRPSGRV